MHRDYLANGSEVHIDIYDDRMEIYSPGGMADGLQIQDRDPITVPSTRRNPLLADVFNRLGYMERKGSGFGKIIDGYELQVTFNESKKPSFYSDRSQFKTIMPNLNYNISDSLFNSRRSQNGSENGSEKNLKEQTKIDEYNKQKIMYLIKHNNKMSQHMMGEQLGITRRVIQRLLKELINDNKVVRGGADKGGHWEVIDEKSM